MKNQMLKSGLFTGTLIAAILLAFSFIAVANVTTSEMHSENAVWIISPDGDKLYDTKCGGESKEAKKSDKKQKTGAVSAEKKTTEEGKCGEGKCGESKTTDDKKSGTSKVSSEKKTKTSEGKCGEGKCGEGKCGVSKH
jgi:uncharacterized low-complexity protein